MKHEEKYLVERRGKFNVDEKLSRLPFNIPRTNKYTCKGCLQLLKKRHGLTNQLHNVDCKLKSAFGIVESDQPEESLAGGKQPSVDTGELFVQTPKKYRFEHNVQNRVCLLTSSPIAIRRVCAAEFQLIQPPQCLISSVRKTKEHPFSIVCQLQA